jgi:hypothetical protein
MQWDNEGYVPISFIADFNRVRSIGANIYQIKEVTSCDFISQTILLRIDLGFEEVACSQS